MQNLYKLLLSNFELCFVNAANFVTIYVEFRFLMFMNICDGFDEYDDDFMIIMETINIWIYPYLVINVFHKL